MLHKVRKIFSYTITRGLEEFFHKFNLFSVLTGYEHAYQLTLTQNSTNPLVRCGGKYYSQGDEDGILLEILRRLHITNGSFLEFGVGNGLENNSLILLMSGWRGAWVGGEKLAFDIPPNTTNLHFTKAWLNLKNIDQITAATMQKLGVDQVDVLSLDLDGNDWHFWHHLMANGARPKVIIAEYNGKFPPPISFSIPYDPDHIWNGDDWYGVSLQTLVTLFNTYGYSLVACGAAGVNAFFVRTSDLAAFGDVPSNIAALFVAPVTPGIRSTGHTTSPRTVASFLRADP